MTDNEHIPWQRYDRLSRWPVHYLRRTGQFFITLGDVHLAEGRHWVPVLDVTDDAPHLRLSGGYIPEDWRTEWGTDYPSGTANRVGEAYAEVGSEGRYAEVLLKDGTRRQVDAWRQIAVDVTIPSATDGPADFGPVVEYIE